MILIINTCLTDRLEVILAKSADDWFSEAIIGERQEAKKLLKMIEKILKKNKIKQSALTGIGIVTGPGGFTSVRIGVAVANALAYGWQLRVAGLKTSEFQSNQELVKMVFSKLKQRRLTKIAKPFYDQKPNITTAKP